MKRKLALVFMLVLMLLMLVPFEALAQEIVDDSAGSSQESPLYRRSFYAEGRYWEFYSTGTGINLNWYYKSSLDGTTWTSRTSFTISYNLDIAFDGTYIHVVESWTGGIPDTVYYNRGTPHSDGTITFDGWKLVSGDTNVALATICVDEYGYPYVGFAYAYSAGVNLDVAKSSTKDGTWTQEWKTTIAYSTTGWFYHNRLVALTDSKIVALYTLGYSGVIYARRWTGSAWGSVVHTTSSISLAEYYSAVGQDDNVHVVALKKTSYDIFAVDYSYSTNSFSAETTIYSAATSTSIPAMSMDNANNLHVFWENDPVDDHMYYAKYNYGNGTWVSYYDLIDEIDDLPATGYYLNTDYTCDESRVGVYYIAGTTILKFKLLGEVFHVDTLSVSANVGATATMRGEIISLGFGSATNRGFWINSSPDLGVGATQHDEGPGVYNVGVFTHGLTGLTVGQKYYYIAYATSGWGTSYGTWTQFYAGGSSSGFVVTTGNTTDIGDEEATFNGALLAASGTFTIRGFEWGYSDVATWSWEGTAVFSFSLGAFEHIPTGLTPDSIYYVRAYGGNATELDYGEWVGFMTTPLGFTPSGELGPYNTQCYLPITVSSNSTTAYSNIRLMFPINAASLVSTGFMRSDALDTFLADGDTLLEHSAVGMASDNSTWMGRVSSIPAHWANELDLWMRNPAVPVSRNQTWEAFSGDSITVGQSVSTNITNNLAISAVVKLDDNVVGTRYIVNKPNSYWLGTNGTALQGGVYTSGGAINVTYCELPVMSTHTVRMTYVSGSGLNGLRLYLEGSLAVNMTVIGTIDTNENGLSMLGINGTVDELTIGNLTSPILRYAFEPVQISKTSIADQTGNGNNASYVLGPSMPPDVYITLGAISCIGGFVPPAGGGSLVPTPVENVPPNVHPVPSAPLIVTQDVTGLPLYDLFKRAADSYGWSVPTMYSMSAFIVAISMGFAASIGTGSFLWGGITAAGVLGMAGAAGILDWWIPLIIGLFVVMIIALLRAS